MTRTADAYDELAALFLTAPEAHAQHGRRTNGVLDRGTPRLEIVLAGHLPVRGALWLGPYADARACAAGPTALVRLDADGPSLELFRSPRPMGREGAASSLRGAIDSLRDTISAWLIRPGHEVAAAPAVAEALAAAPDAELTILTGADEAAIVAAYQTIKDVAAAVRARDGAPPHIALGILGCDEVKAAHVVERVQQTAAAFLEVELKLSACVPSIGAGLRATGYQRFAGDPSPSLDTVLEWVVGCGERSPKLALAASGPEVPFAPRPIPAPPAPTVTIETATRTTTLEFPRIEPPPPQPSVKLRPKPVASRERNPAEGADDVAPACGDTPVTDSPSLAAHVEGLRAMSARCPGHETIELAADLTGAIHVLAWERDLRGLRVVAAWAKAHATLLALACPHLAIDAGASVVSHLFTDTPASVSDLHGSSLRLHVLAAVRVGERKAWYAAPLNANVAPDR